MAGVRNPSGKSQVAIGFLRNTGTDPPRYWVQLPLEGVHTALCVIRNDVRTPTLPDPPMELIMTPNLVFILHKEISFINIAFKSSFKPFNLVTWPV